VVAADQNPFRVARIEGLAYRAPDFDWEVFLARLEAPGVRGAIVGPHGSGKTTLLLEAQSRLKVRGVPVRYGFLNDDSRYKARQARALVAETPREAVLFLDGAEQLDGLTWQWLRWRTRRLRGFVITIHQPGRLPTIHTTETREPLLRELLEQLLGEEWERYWLRAREHFARCGGNIREVLFALYDDCARGEFEPRMNANRRE
jgi:hypothetical protein